MESIRYKLRASESLFKVAQPVSSTPLLSSVKKAGTVGEAYVAKAGEKVSLDLSWAKTRKMRYRDSVHTLCQLKINGTSLNNCTEYQIKHLKISSKLKDLLILLKDKSPSIKDYQTCIYRKVVRELRELSEKNTLDTASFTTLENKIIKALCYLHFTLDINSTENGLPYVKNLFEDGFSDTLLNPSKLNKSLSTVFRKRSIGIEISDLKRRLSANISFVYWDPSLYSIRSSFSTMNVEGKPVHFLRTACPVLGSSGTPRIDPLFKGYLSSLKATQRHLYVNNLSHDPKSDHRRKKLLRAQVGLEFKRSEKLKELSLDPKYSQKIKLLTLPHDSDFYRQKGAAKNMKPDAFIDEFVKNVDGNLQGFYFPDSIKGQLGRHVREQLNAILKDLFQGKGELTIEDRKIMIQVAYADITKSLLKRWDITHCNITCKDGVDRAMGSLANLQVRLNPETSVEQTIYTLANAATLHHARPPKFSRVVRSLASINRMMEFSKI